MRPGEGRAVGLALAAVLAVALVVLLPATPVAACSCVMPQPVSEGLLDEYDAVFTGEITRNETDGDMQRRELDVAVDEVWKGEAEATTLVVTHAQTPACGVDATVGTRVLFLMRRGGDITTEDFVADDELVVMSCGGHRSVSEAAALGPGRSPPEVTSDADSLPPAEDDDRTADLIVGAVGLLAAAVLAAAVVVGRRRAHPGGAA